MKRATRSLGPGVFAAAFMVAGSAGGALSGTVATAPGATVTPGLTIVPAGTLLATLSAPFTAATGTVSGTVISAVYREAGGTLDFYYQVSNNTTSTNCGSGGQLGCDSLARLAGISFFGFETSLGYRIDGGSTALLGASDPFIDGTVPPTSGDRDSAGTVVSFSFFPPDSAKVHPGSTSNVLVVSTDATNFTTGDVTVSDGGFATVASFAPSGHNLVVTGSSPTVPEFSSFSGSVGTFTDTDLSETPSNFTATIDWGDATTAAGTVVGSSGSFTVTGSHTFADEGSFSGMLTVTDVADNITKSAPVNFTVTEGDSLTGTGVAFAVTPGVPFSGNVANFTDTNTANVPSDFTATIDWGDATTTVGTVSGGSGAFAVNGTHTYASAGAGFFTVTTTLTDDAPGTASAIAKSTATIPGAIPMLGWPGLTALIVVIGLGGVLLMRRLG